MLHTPTDLKFSETARRNFPSLPPSATDSLLPRPDNYLVRSNLPGLCFEIEKPDADFPLNVETEKG
ncbi:MAG: hypothetical protein LBU76_07085 [Azoarcus sp.]|jgi:hypothetical protein|nr:hypothetical protein [Azoarcus sp.]